MKSLILIADYCTDSLATTEAILAIHRHAQIPCRTQSVASRPFNTIHTGFLLAQLTQHLSPIEAKNTVFFLNTDPRTHTINATKGAEGAPLVAAWLKNGIIIITPNAGYCLSLVKNEIKKLSAVKVPADGSQFRSRDIFPRVVAAALKKSLSSSTLKPITLTTIPELPTGFMVFHNDNYGNIKTSLTLTDFAKLKLKWGDRVEINLNHKKSSAKVLPTIFADGPGTLVLAPGSSGDPKNPYCELSWRFNGDPNKSAASIFNWPEPGTFIKITPKK